MFSNQDNGARDDAGTEAAKSASPTPRGLAPAKSESAPKQAHDAADDIADVHPVVKELLKDFESGPEGVRMSDERIAHWEREIVTAVRPDERELVGTHLVATGVKFQRLAPDASKIAIEQLIRLSEALTIAAEAEGFVSAGSRDIGFDTGHPARDAGRLVGADINLCAPKVGEAKPKSDFVLPRRLR